MIHKAMRHINYVLHLLKNRNKIMFETSEIYLEIHTIWMSLFRFRLRSTILTLIESTSAFQLSHKQFRRKIASLTVIILNFPFTSLRYACI